MKPLISAGIDAGSSGIKVAVTASRAGDRAEVLATAVQRVRRRNVFDVVQATFDEACLDLTGTYDRERKFRFQSLAVASKAASELP